MSSQQNTALDSLSARHERLWSCKDLNRPAEKIWTFRQKDGMKMLEYANV